MNGMAAIEAAFAPTYGSSPIKRLRRTKADVEQICQAIEQVLRRYQPMTVRQVFYQLVSLGVIAKAEAEYKTTGRLLVRMRREGRIAYSAIADNTRWQRKPRTHADLNAALREAAEWLPASRSGMPRTPTSRSGSKRTRSPGVLYEETQAWDVPLMVMRGFSSVTFLHSAAEAIAEVGKPAYLYYFGDRDPSGVVIDRKIEQDLREMAPGAEIHFERVAVTPEQIITLNLPTRPTKSSDSRNRNFEGESVEVDAIDPDSLRTLSSAVHRATHRRARPGINAGDRARGARLAPSHRRSGSRLGRTA